MTDNYYTLTDEKGSINISEDVIAVIAANAVSEVDGIAAFSNAGCAELGELIGKKPVSKGIRVSFDGNSVQIIIGVMLRSGVNITGVGEKIQKAVTAAVESMTGLKASVDVIVSGIAFDK